MERNRRKYGKEFKLEAIKTYRTGERSQQEVERELGNTKGLLGKWIESFEYSRSRRKRFLEMVAYRKRRHASSSWNARMPSCGRIKRS